MVNGILLHVRKCAGRRAAARTDERIETCRRRAQQPYSALTDLKDPILTTGDSGSADQERKKATGPAMNYLKTTFLLAALTALFIGMGYLIGGQTGMLVALLVSIGMNVFSWWNSDKMVLSMTGAEPVDETSAPELYALVRELARRAGLPMPRVYIIHTEQPNAFATGRDPDHAAVAVTTGLLHMLDREELAGVIAHELAHIKNRDTLIMTITATIAGAISMLANFAMFLGGRNRNNPLGIVGTLLMMILAPLAAMLVQMAISRTREYAADREGAMIAGNPLWLARALEKIATGAHAIPNPQVEAHPETAHLFIVNPLTGQGMDNLFSTHPNTENRIAALLELAREMGIAGDVQGRWPGDGAGLSVRHGRPAGSAMRGGPWSRAGRRRGPWG